MDSLTLEILPDGTIKTTTDAVSAANHSTAEAFLRTVMQAAGGASTRTMRLSADLHAALHAHAHDGHTHNHSHQ
jgi:hypothetical protein